jgi:hypothetical protein
VENGKLSGNAGAKKEEPEAESDQNEQSQFPFTPHSSLLTPPSSPLSFMVTVYWQPVVPKKTHFFEKKSFFS